MLSSNIENKQIKVQKDSSSLFKGTTTNVPSLTWDDTGILLPEESDILTGVIEDFQNAFGYQLKFYNEQGQFLLSTPQGQLVTSIAAIISDRNRLLAYYLNQVDPSYATGRMQDGIGRIYFIERLPAENTKVVGVCRGAVGTVIPQGTKVQDNTGVLYEADQTYTIGDNGTVNITFVCTQAGDIACPVHSLQMYQLISGWDNVDNPVAGEVGRYVESQAQFEQRRRQSVAKNSVNSVDSIMAALLTLQDEQGQVICQDAYVTDNDLDSTISKNGIFLKPHSLYICVAALDSEQNRQLIGRTIWNKKPPGCNMNGEQAVNIEDNSGLYSTPPVYTIYYSYAVNIPIHIKVTLARPQFLPNDAVDQIKKTIIEAFTGNDGSQRPRIGSEILASRFYVPVQKLGNWVSIITLYIGRGTPDQTLVQMNINEMPTLDKNDIEVIFNG